MKGTDFCIQKIKRTPPPLGTFQITHEIKNGTAECSFLINNFRRGGFWDVLWSICRILCQVVNPISYWRSGCTFPYILFFRHFVESWTPLTPAAFSLVTAWWWKICNTWPQKRKLIWEAIYDCARLLFDLKIPQLLIPVYILNFHWNLDGAQHQKKN